jgi:hypothetical protein
MKGSGKKRTSKASVQVSKKPKISSSSSAIAVSSSSSFASSSPNSVVASDVPGMDALKFNSPAFLKVKEKLDAWASTTEEDGDSVGGDGVLVAIGVPHSWWEDTVIRELPLKVVYDADAESLFAIELNGGPHHQSVIDGIIFQIGSWTSTPAVQPHFINSPSSQNWGGQRKIADAGLDRVLVGQRETVCVVECGQSQSLNYLHARRTAVFANPTVQVYIFIKIFSTIAGNPLHAAHAGLTMRRMVCAMYLRPGAAIPAFPTSVWSFGTAPLRVQEINNIASWGFAGAISGNVPGGVGAPTANNQAAFLIVVASNVLWVPPPPQPAGVGNFQIDLFPVLLQLRMLP